jgi:hypothetical protein
MPSMTIADRDEILRRFWPDARFTAAQISKMCGQTERWAYARSARIGLPSRYRIGAAVKANVRPEEDNERFKSMWLAGDPAEAIARAFGCKARHVYKIRAELGLPARQPAPVAADVALPASKQAIVDYWRQIGLAEPEAALRASILTARGAAIEAALFRKQGARA